MSFSMIILLFFVINFSVNAQFWNITTTNTGLPVDNDVAVRIYNNYAALLGDSLRFCHYENANFMNCFTRLNSTCRAGDFYADGSDIYFIALGYHDQKIYVYQLSMTVTTPRALLRQNITISDNPKSISIDYHHRWMAVGGKERLHIYDILNPASIRLTSKSTKLSLLSYFTLNSATSMHKNRVCTCEDSINYIRDYGLICFPVSKGILGPATRYQSFVGFMSVKIYNDLIIAGLETTGDIVIFDTSMTLLRFNTDVNYSIFDFSRSGNVIIAADYFAIGNPICFFDISNPKNPVLLASSTFSVDGWPMSLFLAPDALFATSRIGDSSSGNSVHVKVDINFPPGQNWSTFYANSEWNDYGRVKNTLAYHGSIYTLVYGQSDTTFLNFDIADIYLPTGVSITYTVDSVPFDYALEKLQTTWVELTGGEAFQHSDIVSKFIRIRYLNKENPLVRNLNQTITLTADNGRGSQLQFTMPVTRIYQKNNCVPFGTCYDNSSFTCLTGTQVSTDGRQCIPCPAGTVFQRESSVCVPVSQNNWFILNPVLGLVIIVCEVLTVFLCAFIGGFSIGGKSAKSNHGPMTHSSSNTTGATQMTLESGYTLTCSTVQPHQGIVSSAAISSELN